MIIFNYNIRILLLLNKLVIPTILAVTIIVTGIFTFALGFVVVTPYVMAEMGEKKHGDMTEKINAYCAMSAEEQAEVIAMHNKSDEMVSKMNEYCLLDEEEREAKMTEMKSKPSGMTGEYDASKHAGMTGMTGESEQELKFAIMDSDGVVSTYGKQGYSSGIKAVGTGVLAINSDKICGLSLCSEKMSTAEIIQQYLQSKGLD